jgi:hypothetical protein
MPHREAWPSLIPRALVSWPSGGRVSGVTPGRPYADSHMYVRVSQMHALPVQCH